MVASARNVEESRYITKMFYITLRQSRFSVLQVSKSTVYFAHRWQCAPICRLSASVASLRSLGTRNVTILFSGCKHGGEGE